LAFTETQQRKVIAAINKKAQRTLTCTVCRSTRWTLADGLINLTVEDPLKAPAWTISPPSTGIFFNSVLPAYAIVCQTCGQILLFNAAALGYPHRDFSFLPPPPGTSDR
jgi:hypothetical protein